jgi:hypothetical protein
VCVMDGGHSPLKTVAEGDWRLRLALPLDISAFLCENSDTAFLPLGVLCGLARKGLLSSTGRGSCNVAVGSAPRLALQGGRGTEQEG